MFSTPAMLLTALLAASPAFASAINSRATFTRPTGQQAALPFCFQPPDRSNLTNVGSTCNALFTEFAASFGKTVNQTYTWTGENSRWHEAGVVHLPKIGVKISDDQTHACLMEVVDFARFGDDYTPLSVVAAAKVIQQQCFSRGLCGEMPLGPNDTTGVTLCGATHASPDKPAGLSAVAVPSIPSIDTCALLQPVPRNSTPVQLTETTTPIQATS